MAALEQFQRAFALAHAALAGDQHTDAKHIHQHAVLRYPRRKRLAQVRNRLAGKQARLALRAVDRHTVLLRLIQQGRRALHAPCNDDARYIVGEIALQTLEAHILRQIAQIRHLRLADHLRTLIGKHVKIAGKLQTGAADIRTGNGYAPIIRRIDHFQFQRFGKFLRHDHAAIPPHGIRLRSL